MRIVRHRFCEFSEVNEHWESIKASLKAAVADADYTAAAAFKQQLHELTPISEEAPALKRQRLGEQLQAALSRADYTAAAGLKQQLGELPPTSTFAIDRARERLEKQLKDALARTDYTAAATLKQQILGLISIPR